MTWLPVKAPRLPSAGGVALRHALDVGGRRGPRSQRVDRGALVLGGQLVDEGMLGGHDGIGHAEAGVGPGGEDPDRETVATLDGQVELRALGPSDPVALHRLGPFRPLEIVQGLEELVGVLRDAEEPLLQVALDDEIAGAVTGAVGQHLLIGQHGLTAGAPVDRGEGPVGQARLPKPQEDQLVPLDVGGVVAVDFASPVVDGPEAPQRRRELGDPGVGEDPRVGPGLDGGVLGRQAEGVEPDRAEDPFSLHGLVADGQVPEGVVPHVALVRRPGGVGVHAQCVELLPGIVVVDLVGALVIPVALPFALHRIDVVRACHPTRVGDTLVGSGPISGWPRGRRCGRFGPSAAARDGTGRVSPTASVLSTTGGVAQLVERLTGSQEVRGFKSHRLHQESERARLYWI